MLTTFCPGWINEANAFNAVVFPLAVPPAISIVERFSAKYHMYAAISTDTVPNLIKSIIVIGSARNRLIVKVLPLFVISCPNVRFILLPSGRDASIIGSAIDTCFPQMYANLRAKLFSSCSVSKIMFDGIDSCSLCQMYNGMFVPSQLISSIIWSLINASIFPRYTKSLIA